LAGGITIKRGPKDLAQHYAVDTPRPLWPSVEEHADRARPRLACSPQKERRSLLAMNVADALHAVQSDADTLRAAYTAERAAFKSLEIARRQLPARSYQLRP
jgi:hypothetical protein